MKINLSYDSKLNIDLDKISVKNPLGDELVRPVRKFAKSVIETNSIVQKPKTYNKANKNPIHDNR